MTNLYLSLAIYSALAIALAFGFWLFLATRSEIALLRKEVEECRAAMQGSGNRAGLDLARREQILRRAAQGEKPDAIAATLRLPRNEVDLTLKLAERLATA